MVMELLLLPLVNGTNLPMGSRKASFFSSYSFITAGRVAATFVMDARS